MSLPLMKNYINGDWVESNSTTFGDVWNPAKGEKIAQVAYGTAADVDKAVKAAKEAYWDWRTTPPLTRARYLFRLKDAFEENFEEIAEVLTIEQGKAIDESRGEVRRMIENVEHATGVTTLMCGYTLEDIAQKHHLKLIFDSAHALGSVYKEQPVGGFGDVECFSLSGTKVITSAEGGIATSNDQEFMAAMDLGRNYGAGSDYNCQHFGLNGKMSEFHAAIAIESLLLMSDLVQARNEFAALYRERLADIPGIRFQVIPEGHLSTFKDFAIIVDQEAFGMDREELFARLQAERIFCKRYFHPPLHRMAAYQTVDYRAENLENTNRVSDNILCLPIYSHMNPDTIEKIAFAILRIWKSGR